MLIVDKKDLITIREATPTDINFIYATWLRGLYHGNNWFTITNKQAFMTHYHDILTGIMSDESNYVRVACLKDTPYVILGYSVLSKDNTVAHWVHVKQPWRNIKIANDLVPPTVKTVTHLTKVGLSILHKKSLEFNPFLLLKPKGDKEV